MQTILDKSPHDLPECEYMRGNLELILAETLFVRFVYVSCVFIMLGALVKTVRLKEWM